MELVKEVLKCSSSTSSMVWKLAIIVLLLLYLKLLASSTGFSSGSTRWWEGPLSQPLQQALDARLQTMEARLEWAVTKAVAQAGSGREVEERVAMGDDSGEPKTDIAALLQRVAVDSPEADTLREMQYCHKYKNVSKVPAKFLDPWVPHSGKYLFPLCTNGQVSNRLVCMQSYVLLAALLNRTLVVPEKEPGQLGYDYRLVFDVDHARRCIGDANKTTVITLSEYRERMAAPGQAAKDVVVQVQRVLNFKRYLGSTARRLWPAPSSKVVVPDKSEIVRHRVHSVAQFIEVVGSAPEGLISLGDLFWLVPFPGTPVRLNAEEDMYWQGAFPDMPSDFTSRPSPPFSGLSCTLFMQPHSAILEAAKGFVSAVLGREFLAIHWRRGDFLQFWNDQDCRQSGKARRECRLHSISATAGCIREKLGAPGNSHIQVVYAATNARPAEVAVLRRLLAPVAVVTTPTEFAVPWTWAEGLLHHNLSTQSLAVATLDKVVSAMATIFMGTLHSTFTQEIVAMRSAFGTLSCQDQDLCRVFPQYDALPALPFFNQTDFKAQPFR